MKKITSVETYMKWEKEKNDYKTDKKSQSQVAAEIKSQYQIN